MAKTQKKQRLGRGLSAILNNDDIKSAEDKGAESVVGSIIEIPLDQIVTNPHQPRTQFDEQAINELATSIKQLGVIQPITVRKNKDKFDLISGERRLRASKIAGLESIQKVFLLLFVWPMTKRCSKWLWSKISNAKI